MKEFQVKVFVNKIFAGKKFFRIGQGESLDHVVLKLLGFILFHEYSPEIEYSIGWKYKPDLIAFDDNDKIILWVECADVAPAKIRRIMQKYPDARLVVLKPSDHKARGFSKIFEDEKKEGVKIEITGFDDGFVDHICRNLFDRGTIEAKIEGNTIEILINGKFFASELHIF